MSLCYLGAIALVGYRLYLIVKEDIMCDCKNTKEIPLRTGQILIKCLECGKQWLK